MPLLDGWGLCEAIRKMGPQGAAAGSRQRTDVSVQDTAYGTAQDTTAGNGSFSGARCRVSDGAGSRTIVIGMSAAGTNNEEKAAQAGMDGFLVKPFRLAEMMRIIAGGANSRASSVTSLRAGAGAAAGASASASAGVSPNARAGVSPSGRASGSSNGLAGIVSRSSFAGL